MAHEKDSSNNCALQSRYKCDGCYSAVQKRPIDEVNAEGTPRGTGSNSSRTTADGGDDLCAVGMVLGPPPCNNGEAGASANSSYAKEGDADPSESPHRRALQTPAAVRGQRDSWLRVGNQQSWPVGVETNEGDGQLSALRIQLQEGWADRQALEDGRGGQEPMSVESVEIQTRLRSWQVTPEPCRWGEGATQQSPVDGVRGGQDSVRAASRVETNADDQDYYFRTFDGQERSHRMAGELDRRNLQGSPQEAGTVDSSTDDRRPLVSDARHDNVVSGRVVSGARLEHGVVSDSGAWRHAAILLQGCSPIVWGMWGGPFNRVHKGKRAIGHVDCSGCRERDFKIRKLEATVQQEKLGAVKQVQATMTEARRLVRVSQGNAERSKWYAKSASKAQRKAVESEQLAIEERRLAEEKARKAEIELEELRMHYRRLEQLQGRLECQHEHAKRLNARLRESAIPVEVHERALLQKEAEVQRLHSQLEDQLSLVAEARRTVAALEQQVQEDEHEDSVDESAEESCEKQLLTELRLTLGLEVDRDKLPERTFTGDAQRPWAKAKWRSRSIRHIVAVLQERGAGEDIDIIATALDRLGYLEPLVDSPTFKAVRKRLAQETMSNLQLHWSARHAVHVWDRRNLSRSQMETLRHLLSFVYDPVTNRFEPIRVWEDPDNPKSFVAAAKLACRQAREKDFNEIAETCNIVVGANGRCERNALRLTELMYTDFAEAMRKNFSDARPAQPILFVDGTGASLGRGTCHSEMGSADFTGDCKQSRSTLSPLSQHEGKDHALDLRENMGLAFSSFNMMSDEAKIKVGGRDIPCRPSITADMQGVKSIAGQALSSHSVWCKCRTSDADSKQHDYGQDGHVAHSYSEVLAEIERVGCEWKTEEFLCNVAHLPLSFHRHGKFSRFTCPECGYSPTKAQFEAELRRFNNLSDEEQADERKEHVVRGQHWHQLKFIGPMQHFGMQRIGADQLHLIYFINFFKHLFRYTVHEALPESTKKLIAEYLVNNGFYSYSALSLDEDPVKQWIGREVKRFLVEAHIHLPFLLRA